MSSSMPANTQWITLAPGFDGYLALPPGGTGPGLLLCQEIFGVNAHIRAVAEQFALDGFVVLAPDLFWRAAPRIDLGYEGRDREQAFTLMQGYTTDDSLSDLSASVDFLRQRTEVGANKVGAIGYCMGGRLAYLAAADAGVDAAVAYYGGGIQHHIGRAAQIACPVQFHYAGHDDHIPPAAVESVRSAFAGRAAEVWTYAQAHHGFNCWARGSYHPASSALARGRALAFLSQHLWDVAATAA